MNGEIVQGPTIRDLLMQIGELSAENRWFRQEIERLNALLQARQLPQAQQRERGAPGEQ